MNEELKQKVRPLSPDDIDHMQQRADGLIAALSGQFHAYASGTLAEIDGLMAASRYEDDAWRGRLSALAHDLKGLGGTFGYDLMTIVAEAMCKTSRDQGLATSENLQRRLAALAAALNAIVQFDLKGGRENRGRDPGLCPRPVAPVHG